MRSLGLGLFLIVLIAPITCGLRVTPTNASIPQTRALPTSAAIMARVVALPFRAATSGPTAMADSTVTSMK